MATNWISYEEETVVGTLKQLDGPQKLAILDSFSRGLSEVEARRRHRIPLSWVQQIYTLLRGINQDAILVQRGEYIEAPGDPPTYNTVPATSTALRNYMQSMYTDILSASGTLTALTAMVKWSNGLGTANYTYWKGKVTA